MLGMNLNYMYFDVLFEKYIHTNVILNNIFLDILYNLIWHTNGAFSYVIFVSQSMLPYLK